VPPCRPLTAFASPGHILFGTDFPYDHGVSAAFTAALDSSDGLTAEDRTAICYCNAQALFPRLAAGPEKATT
jgi:predicted TIM-barrel fold metal-dependent hydrolase